MSTYFRIALLSFFLVLTGCATNLSKPSQAPGKPSIAFGKYDVVRMQPVTLNPQFSNGANQRATTRIEANLATELSKSIPGFTQDGSSKAGKVLLIEPQIQEIKFVSGATRFFLGAMAGSSAVLMKVVYRDARTGKVLAEPQFYQQANAFSGSASIGRTDNRMLDDIARDVATYTVQNRY